MVHPLLKEVLSRNQFWVADGRSLKNLEDLALALQDMDETTFRQHVNKHKNDFHSWVRDVHQDKKLAGTLLKIKQKKHAFKAVQERVKELIHPEEVLQKKEGKNKEELKNISVPSSPRKKSLRENNISSNFFPKVSWYRQTTVWVVLVFTLLAVALVGTISPIVVTGAAVGSVVGRGTALLGMTLIITGFLFIVSAVRSPKRIEKLSRKSMKKTL